MIERFLNGETTNGEERELYDFFAGADVPAHLEPYRAMFAWFDGGLVADAPRSVGASRPRHRFVKVAVTVMAVAAALVVCLMPRQPETYIEGYIMRNGVMITDPEIVSREMAASWELCERQLRCYEEMEDDVDAFMLELATFENKTLI